MIFSPRICKSKARRTVDWFEKYVLVRRKPKPAILAGRTGFPARFERANLVSLDSGFPFSFFPLFFEQNRNGKEEKPETVCFLFLIFSVFFTAKELARGRDLSDWCLFS